MPPGRPPRQADIARIAGVSQATVSVVLGGNRAGVRMAEETRLAKARTNMIGLYTFRATFPTDVADSGFPLVYIGRRHELAGRIPYVGADYVTASADLLTRLRGLGHRHIRYVRETDDAPPSADREHGVRRGAPDAVVTRLEHGDLPADIVRAWVRDGVTAIVVEETDTGAAYTALRRALDAAALSTPDDVSLAVLGRPPVPDPDATGFEVPFRAMGGQAVRLLVDLVTEQETTPRRLLRCPPVTGRTVGAAPKK